MKALFECEVCGSVYPGAELAALCEQYKLPPCPVKVGAPVRVKTRYEGIAFDEVTAVLVRPGSLNEYAGNHWLRGPAEWAAFLARNADVQWHEYAVRTKVMHRLGKEWWDNIVPASNCVELGGGTD